MGLVGFVSIGVNNAVKGTKGSENSILAVPKDCSKTCNWTVTLLDIESHYLDLHHHSKNTKSVKGRCKAMHGDA